MFSSTLGVGMIRGSMGDAGAGLGTGTPTVVDVRANGTGVP